MKIKYLKPAPNASTGDIKDINTAQAKILIQLGFAKEYDETDSDDGDTGDLFGQLGNSQDSEPPTENQEPQETTEPVADNQEPPETGEATNNDSEQVQTAENNKTTEITKTKKSKPKKTDTENN
ncbi:hypothetical protein AAX05_03385 [Moraxella bovoculi]|uniref:hypothetical protein n=1 Tax=Moraxella bovoculi TaxID=386891 RepID=UPI0006248D04|nr:hypothetical protein [Moraxella bovoculi]AKG09374.1 hypothetical protein AAX05_03385 [Moraxella bovoculi]AKG13200.1 hypothetical protein AAX11_03135 [Moraxella bovoculi]